MTTAEIDRQVRAHTAKLGGRPAQLGYHGFPAAVCIISIPCGSRLSSITLS